MSFFPFSKRGLLSSTHIRFLAEGDDTDPLISSPNISKASYICCFISISSLLSFVMLSFIPKKSCVFPRVIISASNFVLKSSRSSSTTLLSLCDIFLSLTHHPIVHYDPFMTLLTLHLS